MNNIKRLTAAEANKRYSADKPVYCVFSPSGRHGFYSTKASAERVGQSLGGLYEVHPVDPSGL